MNLTKKDMSMAKVHKARFLKDNKYYYSPMFDNCWLLGARPIAIEGLSDKQKEFLDKMVKSRKYISWEDCD